ncbi:tripartite motif-containing protein 16-like protein [Microcaecilia unicolor]|uniref:Tripartite motif-containing protein 16-like protein n=1 Tax=Microcaecilia unicolor TaxID=1415580 RepID=A0A6P7YIH3_9AMPH|nr:tripartite motif-containing protein 16-like protein [Microcaecilia unicolor]
MAAAHLLFSREYLRCSVCLDMFQNPVTIPCGHSFCLGCIEQCWAQPGAPASCPQCRTFFEPTPRLCKNHILTQLVQDLTSSVLNLLVPCDLCLGQRVKILSSCPACMTTCLTHLGNSMENLAHNSPQLTEGADRQCLRHDRFQALFCTTDQSYICLECLQEEHRGHSTICEDDSEKQIQSFPHKELQRGIQCTEDEIYSWQTQMNAIKIATLRDKEELTKSFSDMVQMVTSTQEKVQHFMESLEQAVLIRIEAKLQQLMEKREALLQSKEKLDQLSQPGSNLQLLQSLEGLKVETKPSSSLSFPAEDFTSAHLVQVVTEFKEQLHHLCKKHMDRIMQKAYDVPAPSRDLLPGIQNRPLLTLKPQGRVDFLQYARKLTLDLNTVHRNLCLMAGNRKVTCKLQPQAYPEHPERFDHFTQVLCQERFTSGRHYWEVQLSGNQVGVGVAYWSIQRKGHERACLLGRNTQSWCLEWNSSRCTAWHNNQKILIPKRHHDRLGVFLDYTAGTLSFYEVADGMLLIHTFQAAFDGPLCPIFFLSWNSFVTIGECSASTTKSNTVSIHFKKQFSADF